MSEKTTSESPISVSDITQQPWWMRYFIYIVGAAFVIMFMYIVGGLYPFHPWTFHDYILTEKEVCVGQPIPVKYDQTVTPGPYIVGKIEGEGYLVTEDGKPLESYPVDQELPNRLERSVSTSPVERDAPTYTGRFYVGADLTVNGYVFGFVPNYQHEKIQSSEMVTVLPASDPSCRTLPLEKGD